MVDAIEKYKLDCADVISYLGDYLEDKDISRTLWYRIDEHLKGCEYCSSICEEYIRTIKSAKYIKDTKLSSSDHNKFRSQIGKKLGIQIPDIETDW